MSMPIEGKPTLQISQSNLQRSDALRASMGLPPLETQVNAQVVKPTPEGETGTTTLYGKTFTTFTPKNQDSGVASSFLKTPFVGTKSGTNQVPSITILDPLQFVGVGGATRTAIKGGSAIVNIFKSESKPVVKEGAKDIGLNIPASKTFESSQRFERQTRTLPKPDSITPPRLTPPPKPQSTPPSFTSTNINLGRGIGFIVPKGNKGSTASTFFKPPPKPPEVPKPNQGKEVSAGKGLMQIVKEKPLTQQKQVQQFKNTPVYLGKTTLQTVQKTKQTTKADQLMKDYMKSLQSLSLKRQAKQKQAQDLMYISPQKTKQRQDFINPPAQKQKFVPIIPIIFRQIPKQTPKTIPTPKQTPIQKPTPLLKIPPTMFIPPPRTSPVPTKTPNTILPPPREPPTSKKRPPVDIFGKFDSINGGGGNIFGGGATKAFVGNVPEYQFTGMFNRIETRYGKGGSIPRGYKVTSKPASNAFTAFSRASGQGKKSKSSKPLSNKFTRLI